MVPNLPKGSYFYLSCPIPFFLPMSGVPFSSLCRYIHTPRLSRNDSALCSHTLVTSQSLLSCLPFAVSVSKPTVTTGSGYGFMVPQGMRISLQCQAWGSPPISYVWYKKQTNNQEPIKVGVLSTLLFKPAVVTDSGSYFCTAKGRLGSEQHSDTVKFVVKGEQFSFLVSISMDYLVPEIRQYMPLFQRREVGAGWEGSPGLFNHKEKILDWGQ